MNPIVFAAVIHGRPVDIGCRGFGGDWLCRVSPPPPDVRDVHDGYVPPADFGFFWLRENHERWFASGMVHLDVFRDAKTIDEIIYRIMKDVLHCDEQLASCVELVESRATSIFSNEEGLIFFESKPKP